MTDIKRNNLTSLIGKTISAVQLSHDGETVKIFDREGNCIISVAATRLYDGDGFHFELPAPDQRMTQYRVIGYNLNERQVSNEAKVSKPADIVDYVLGGMCSLHEYHVIFTDSKGQDRVALCTRRRLNEVGADAFKAELIAFLSL